jgi:hypothetical protein
MHQIGRSLVSICLLMLVGLLALAGAPIVVAQGTPVATPLASAAEAEPSGHEAPCVATDATSVDEDLPAGLVREMVYVTEVDSSGFFDPGPPLIPSLLAMSSVICIEPNTLISVNIEGANPTENVSQFYTTTIVALSGDLEIKLVEQCANESPMGVPPCTVGTGYITYRTADDLQTVHELAVGEWTPIPPGSIVTLADVTVSYRTGDSITRFLTSGVWAETPPGGACPAGCGRWRNP